VSVVRAEVVEARTGAVGSIGPTGSAPNERHRGRRENAAAAVASVWTT